MHKRAFQALKRTFMHVRIQDFPHHIYKLVLLSKYGGEVLKHA